MNSGRRVIIGVIGAGSCPPEVEELAAQLGREIAGRGAVLVCGGLSGVMTAAARGAREAGGTTIGILPGTRTADANPYIDFPVATGMGQARNVIIAQTADVLISVSGSYGTLSEIAHAFKAGKRVVSLLPRFEVEGIVPARDAREAVDKAMALIGRDER